MQYRTLAERLANKLNLSRDEVDALCDSLSEIIGNAGAELDSVAIPTFGSFEPKKRAERISVNPANGVRMLIPPKMVIGFRPSAILRKKVRDLDSNIPDDVVSGDFDDDQSIDFIDGKEGEL